MRRPPASVAFVARVHWTMGAALAAFVGALHLLLRKSSAVELSRTGYAIIIGLVMLYVVTGALVWWGRPEGRWLGHVCSILYFVRPPLGAKISSMMRSDEFKAYLTRKPSGEE